VHASQMLELQPKAQIVGDVFYKALEMHQGAVITGLLQPALQEIDADVKTTLKLAANNF
jgi:cytoskeletal protein CcmA (bactofilin family)